MKALPDAAAAASTWEHMQAMRQAGRQTMHGCTECANRSATTASKPLAGGQADLELAGGSSEWVGGGTSGATASLLTHRSRVLLKHLPRHEGGCSRLAVAPTAAVGRTDRL